MQAAAATSPTDLDDVPPRTADSAATATTDVPDDHPSSPAGSQASPAGIQALPAGIQALPATRALSWVEASELQRLASAHAHPHDNTDEIIAGLTPVSPALLARPPRRSPFRPGVILPALVILLVIGAYAATTLLWPLHAVPPVATTVAVTPIAAVPATPTWPENGAAAVSVEGMEQTLASTDQTTTIASITKLVTALLVLDQMPLELGEQGPDYAFTSSDNADYWSYRARGESALDVPVGGTLSEYQMLQGMLIGSANNYADRLTSTLWPTDEVFARAANSWLDLHGVPGITIADPSGIDSGNVASPAALIPLAERALANPVIAEIVATAAVELPGAGYVENTNSLLADPGVVGLKTGTLDGFNLLAAKDVVVDDITVRLYAATLDQVDDPARDETTRALFSQLEQELTLQPSVTAGTRVGTVTTEWGETVAIVTNADASVVLWNGQSASAAVDLDLADDWSQGAPAGTLTVTGPLNNADVSAELLNAIDDPSPWWRLTHPLDLFGLS